MKARGRGKKHLPIWAMRAGALNAHAAKFRRFLLLFSQKKRFMSLKL
jgi:hypothetical protein